MICLVQSTGGGVECAHGSGFDPSTKTTAASSQLLLILACHFYRHPVIAGVMAIVRGSVIALAYVEFKPDTPAKEIELATSHLRTNADRLYGASSLPSAWGGLVSYLVSPNAATLDGAAMEMVPQQRGKTGKLGSGGLQDLWVCLQQLQLLVTASRSLAASITC